MRPGEASLGTAGCGKARQAQDMTDIIRPPWTDEQVEGLNKFQSGGHWHPFTCGNEECRAGRPDSRSHYAVLIARNDGWHCAWCDYTQGWAFAGMPELGLNPPKAWWET